MPARLPPLPSPSQVRGGQVFFEQSGASRKAQKRPCKNPPVLLADNCPRDWVDRFGNEPRKGCDIVVQALEREGVTQVFAYPGGASMEIHQALTRSHTVRNYLCRHEQVQEVEQQGMMGSARLQQR